MSIRSFIAIQLDASLRNEIDKSLRTLKSTGADIRWVKAENIHLTLKFLGNITPDQVGPVSERLDALSQEHKGFLFSLRETGFFPDMRRPRVIWIGVQSSTNIADIAKGIDTALAAEGFEQEKRPFSPHITVGRVRSRRGIDKLQQELVKYKGIEFGQQHVSEIHLVKSILRPDGAKYETMHTAHLRRE